MTLFRRLPSSNTKLPRVEQDADEATNVMMTRETFRVQDKTRRKLPQRGRKFSIARRRFAYYVQQDLPVNSVHV